MGAIKYETSHLTIRCTPRRSTLDMNFRFPTDMRYDNPIVGAFRAHKMSGINWMLKNGTVFDMKNNKTISPQDR